MTELEQIRALTPSGYTSVLTLTPGTLCKIRHQWYEVLETATYGSIVDGKVHFVPLVTCQAIDDEGEKLDQEPVTFNTDNVDITI